MLVIEKRLLILLDIVRFFSYIGDPTPTGCWPWLVAEGHREYGSFRLGNKTMNAYVASWIMFNDIDPPTMKSGNVIRHTCDNPWCVNPAHLHIGTRKENAVDAMKSGRHWRKLLPEQVRAIRASTLSRKELTTKYGVSWGMIKAIQTRRAWAWLD